MPTLRARRIWLADSTLDRPLDLASPRTALRALGDLISVVSSSEFAAADPRWHAKLMAGVVQHFELTFELTMDNLLLPPAQADCVRRVLWTHLPRSVRVSVVGSRATGRGFKPHSDFDLLIDSPVELSLVAFGDVRNALAESGLPLLCRPARPQRCQRRTSIAARARRHGRDAPAAGRTWLSASHWSP